jgi:hypothetical protein
MALGDPPFTGDVAPPPWPVSDVRDRFYASYGKIVPFTTQSFIGEMLSSLTFALSSTQFAYSRVFAFGFESLCKVFLEQMPTEEDKDRIRLAMLSAVGLDAEQMKKDSDAIAAMAAEMTEDQLLESDDFVQVAKTENFKYSYQFGAGLLLLMKSMSLEGSEERIEKWCSKLNIRAATLQKDAAFFKNILEKLSEVKEMLLMNEIKKKKEEAKKLEEKAARLQKEEEEKVAEKPAEEKPSEETS